MSVNQKKIAINPEALEAIESVRVSGQSYSGAIIEAVKKSKQEKST